MNNNNLHNNNSNTQKSTLTDVPETMLWTLHNRASEAMRSDGCIYDPHCLSIYQAIDYDYERSFGKADGSHGVRSQLFDKHIRKFINKYPDAVIVNLGEGLETQRFRMKAHETVLWLSIDVPEAIAMRDQFITPDEQLLHISKSVLDTSWFDDVPKDRPVFITAQGLFMYFSPEQLRPLLHAMAQRFSRAKLMFDYLNVFFSQKSISETGWMKTPHYRTPPMPWGIYRDKLEPTLSVWIGHHVTVHNVTFLFPRGYKRWLIPFLERFPRISRHMPGICWLHL